MADSSVNKSGSGLDQLRNWLQRKFVHYGEKFSRRLGTFLAAQSTIPTTPYIDWHHIPEFKYLIDNTDKIREELKGILEHREHLPQWHELSHDQRGFKSTRDWKMFMLFGFRNRLNKNCAKAPITAEMLEKIPGMQTAWFSILGPQSHIKAHRGVTKGILTCHLPLIVPEARDKIAIRVAGEVLHWTEGEMVILDDTYLHDSWNNSDEERVNLIVHVDRPMRWRGRTMHNFFCWVLKKSSYFNEPRKNMANFEDHFEAVTMRANQTLEKLSLPDQK
ncbi:MAG: aspartyl/asparaginyl beta-hydroxylase domain-containing protein [Anderseniella sp.]